MLSLMSTTINFIIHVAINVDINVVIMYNTTLMQHNCIINDNIDANNNETLTQHSATLIMASINGHHYLHPLMDTIN